MQSKPFLISPFPISRFHFSFPISSFPIPGFTSTPAIMQHKVQVGKRHDGRYKLDKVYKLERDVIGKFGSWKAT